MSSHWKWYTATLALVFAANSFAQVSDSDLKKVKEALPAKAPAKPKQARKILIYTKTLGFRHGSIPIGVKAITHMGEKTGAFTADHSEDPAMFDENRLSQYDAVLFLNTTGDCLQSKRGGKLSEEELKTLQRRQKNLINFVKSGKGFAGIHSATDTFYGWKEYGDMIGAWFTNHPWGNVPIKVDSKKHPLTSMFDVNGFDYRDEIYQFAPKSRAGKYKGYQPYTREKLHVLLSIDGSKFKGKGARPDGDYAISWIRNYGKGRVFYCVLGHSNHTYWNEMVLNHYLSGLQYVLGDLNADATPSSKNSAEDSACAEQAAGAAPNTLTPDEKAAGWQLAFDGKSLNGWRRYGQRDTTGWTVRDGAIVQTKSGSGDLMIAKMYGDFEFSVDWKFEKGNNSGIVYRLAETRKQPWATGPEMQVMHHKPGSKLGDTSGGSLYDMYAPTKNAFKSDGWTTYKIVARGKNIQHWVNGVKVVDCTVGSKDWNDRLAKSKWRKFPEFASQMSGYISLQDHGGAVLFRNIKIREIKKD